MAHYEISTAFRLEWPQAAIDDLERALKAIASEKKDDTLPANTGAIVARLLEEGDMPGIDIIERDERGALVADSEGMFSPLMTGDLLSAIMRDHDIPGVVAVQFAETCSKHRSDSFTGGGFLVSKDDVQHVHVYDMLQKRMSEMDPEVSNSGPSPGF